MASRISFLPLFERRFKFLVSDIVIFNLYVRYVSFEFLDNHYLYRWYLTRHVQSLNLFPKPFRTFARLSFSSSSTSFEYEQLWHGTQTIRSNRSCIPSKVKEIIEEKRNNSISAVFMTRPLHCSKELRLMNVSFIWLLSLQSDIYYSMTWFIVWTRYVTLRPSWPSLINQTLSSIRTTKSLKCALRLARLQREKRLFVLWRVLVQHNSKQTKFCQNVASEKSLVAIYFKSNNSTILDNLDTLYNLKDTIYTILNYIINIFVIKRREAMCLSFYSWVTNVVCPRHFDWYYGTHINL